MARVPGTERRATLLLPQALTDSEARPPAFSVSDQLAADLLSRTGKTPSELQAAIDRSLQPASQPLPDTCVQMRVVLAEQRRGIREF